MFKNYWTDPRQWPRETGNHLPLAKAVIEIGAATISGWSGAEASDTANLTPGLRPYDQANRDDRCRAHRILIEAKAEYQPRPNFKRTPPSVNSMQRSFDIEDYSISRAAYDNALATIGKKNASFAPGAIRLSQAKEEFIRAATMGEFQTAVREATGWQTRPLNPHIWAVVSAYSVFTAGLLNPARPASTSVSGSGFCPVMVERVSFESWLNARRTDDEQETAQREDDKSSSQDGSQGAKVVPSDFERSGTAAVGLVRPDADRRSAELQSPTRPAKKRGAKNLSHKDQPFIDLMRKLVEDEGHTPNKASEIVIAERGTEVAGLGTAASKARRLRDRYAKDRNERGLGAIGD